MKNKLINGDSIDELKKLKDNSVDLLCTDPPYGYGFMGKSWDKMLPPKEIFEESLRVLKPGSFAFVMSAPRSDVQYRMAQMLEDVGFEIGYTPIYWTYATGFPKAMNIYKKTNDEKLDGSYGGYQPKPAVEVVIVAMKPLSQKGYLDQALDNQKGITWLDDCRIPFAGTSDESSPLGRFAANLLVSDDVLNVESKGQLAPTTGKEPSNYKENNTHGSYLGYRKEMKPRNDGNSFSRYYSLDAWWNSRLSKLPDEVRNTFPFLVVPKASKSEKNKGLEKLKKKQKIFNGKSDKPSTDMKGVEQKFTTQPSANNHPTVKPLNLMSYLVTLGSRKNDVVLDPFMGSGTTPMVCVTLSRNYIGIERENEYFEIAEARVNKLEKPMSRWDKWL
jgi:site-specific DNA-methyltransferase (adenine-specific)